MNSCMSGGSGGGGGGGGDEGEERQPTTLQSGNSHTIQGRTAAALNKVFNKDLSARDWGRALEQLKREYGVPNDVHGQIMDNGDFVVNGSTIGNIGHYLP
jgi:filamentous hemagglutinin